MSEESYVKVAGHNGVYQVTSNGYYVYVDETDNFSNEFTTLDACLREQDDYCAWLNGEPLPSQQFPPGELPISPSGILDIINTRV